MPMGPCRSRSSLTVDKFAGKVADKKCATVGCVRILSPSSIQSSSPLMVFDRQLYNDHICTLRKAVGDLLEWRTFRGHVRDTLSRTRLLARRTLRKMNEEEKQYMDINGMLPAWLTKQWLANVIQNPEAAVPKPPGVNGKHKRDRVFDFWIMVTKKNQRQKKKHWTDWCKFSPETKEKWLEKATQHYSAPPPALPPPADPAASSPWGSGGEASSETASPVKGQKAKQLLMQLLKESPKKVVAACALRAGLSQKATRNILQEIKLDASDLARMRVKRILAQEPPKAKKNPGRPVKSKADYQK